MLNNNKLQQVQNFKFLINAFTRNGICDEEIKTRISVGKSDFNSHKKILVCCKISLSIRLGLIKVYVCSAFLYCSGELTLTRVLEKKIEAFKVCVTEDPYKEARNREE